MAQLAWDEVFAVVEPLVVPAVADHPLAAATGVVVAEVVLVVDVDDDEAVGAAATLAAVALVLVAVAEVPAMHAPRATVAATLITAAAMRDRWAARRRGRCEDAG